MQQIFKVVLIIALFILLFALGSVVIQEGGGGIAYIGHYIMNLFHKADLNPSNSGFNEFFQLMLIAVFVGWTIRRFKKKRKK